MHEMDAAKYICSEKYLKCRFSRLQYQIMQISASKDFIKIFPTYFS